MPRTLKTLLSKLKRRRLSRSTAHPSGENVRHDAEHTNMDSGIAQQMTGLTLSSAPADSASPEDVMPKPLIFGISQEFDFKFRPVSAKDWPGPAYDEQSLFAPGVFDKARSTGSKAKHRSWKRKLSQEGGQITLRAKERPSNKYSKDAGTCKKSARPHRCYDSLPPRDPPLHLLNLPGEIRNKIYRTACVSDEPIIAQFRPIIRPRTGRGSRAKLFETTRRFPREPALALGCRQLHKEMLSIFYSENRFIFRQNDGQKFSHLIMTRPGMMEKWTPRFSLRQSLTHVEVHFNVKPTTGGKESISYTLHKLADGRLRISNDADSESYCTCFDKDFLQRLKSGMKSGQACQDLMREAAKVVTSRTDRLRDDKEMMNIMNNGSKFRPMKITCDDCGLDTLRMLESGL